MDVAKTSARGGAEVQNLPNKVVRGTTVRSHFVCTELFRQVLESSEPSVKPALRFHEKDEIVYPKKEEEMSSREKKRKERLDRKIRRKEEKKKRRKVGEEGKPLDVEETEAIEQF